MKSKSFLLFVACFCTGLTAWGFSPKGDGWQVSEMGANHRKWNRVTTTTNTTGDAALKTNTIVELATGMNRLENGNWVASNPHIRPTTNGALCYGAGHQVMLAPNLNTRAAVQIRTPMTNWIQGNVLGLAYTDSATNKSVLIAQVKNCEGKIIDENHVLYADAFTGVKADVRYTYTKAGFEQDVILREQPPEPEVYGLSNETTKLVVVTEFIDVAAPTPVKFRSPDGLLAERGLQTAKIYQAAGDTNWIQSTNLDTVLDFSGMKLGLGKAFELGGESKALASGNSASVHRFWQSQDKRSFLIEEVELKDIQQQMTKLPKLSQLVKPKPQGLRNRVQDQLPLPDTLLARNESKPMLLAANTIPESPGLVLDYNLIGGFNEPNSYSDFVFEPSTTYVIAGPCEMTGTTVFYPGAVLKYEIFTSPDGGDASITTLGPAYFSNVGGDRVYFTSTEDNTVGDLTATTGKSVGVYYDGYSYSDAGGLPAMALYKNALTMYGHAAIRNIEIRYAGIGIAFEGQDDQLFNNYIYNSEFVNCGYAMSVDNLNVFVHVDNSTFYTSAATPQWLWPDVSVCENNWQDYLFDTTPFHVPDEALSWCSFSGSSLSFDMCQTAGFDTSYQPGFCDDGGCDYNFREWDGYSYYFDIINIDGIPDCCEGCWDASALLPPLPPSITQQPVNLTHHVGDTVTLTVSVIGKPPFNYQWTFNGNAIPGATNKTLTLNNVQLNQAGDYAVFVSNLYGSTNSTTASLTVLPPVYTSGSSGLVGWWNGDGDTVDVVSGNNGTFINPAYTTGIVGQAFSFNGSYGGVNVPDQPSYVLTNSLTIECWIRPKGLGAKIISRGDNRPGLDPYQLSMEYDNKVHFDVTQADNTGDGLVSPPLVYNRWVHIAATLDGSTGLMCLYTNGVLAAQKTTIARPLGPLQADCSPGLGIGNLNDNHNNFPFNGDIDEISLYNRALSQREVQAIYNSGSAGKSLAPVITQQPLALSVALGQTASFGVSALGVPPFSYQWMLNGTNVANATNATLVLSSVQLSQVGNYSVRISNAYGTALSSSAYLNSGFELDASGAHTLLYDYQHGLDPTNTDQDNDLYWDQRFHVRIFSP